jgi:hypothetical protein
MPTRSARALHRCDWRTAICIDHNHVEDELASQGNVRRRAFSFGSQQTHPNPDAAFHLVRLKQPLSPQKESHFLLLI